MKYLAAGSFPELEGQIRLVYIDPPFFSGSDYLSAKKAGEEGLGISQKAYPDSWSEGIFEYLKMLCARLYAIRDILAEDGCLWVHLDWHVAHYAKVLLDEIFGMENFVNEVVWTYKSGGATKRHFGRKHDTLLFYGKSDKYYFNALSEKSYNRGLKPYNFKGVEEFKDDVGWYTLVKMKDVWAIDMVGRTSSERTGYATQKPEALLARIIESCSKDGDIVADFFGGSGTTAAVAAKMGRRFIYCDMGKLALGSAEKRLTGLGAAFRVYEEEPSEARIDSEVGKEFKAPKPFLEVKASRRGESIEIELKKYKMADPGSLALDAKSLKNVKSLLERDSLALVDFWAVDYNYNDVVFRPQDVFLSKNGSITKACSGNAPEGAKVAVRAVDIFGRDEIIVL